MQSQPAARVVSEHTFGGTAQARGYGSAHQEAVATETHSLTMWMYLRNGARAMLEGAGFADVEVSGGYDGGPSGLDHEFLVFAARA